MNSVNLIGNVCHDIELKQTNSGKSVVQVNLAVKRPYAKDTTDFIPCVVWGQSAQYLSRYGHKGSKVAVSGKLTGRNYEDKQGNKRVAYEVVSDTVQLLDTIIDSKRVQNTEPAPAPMDAPTFEELENDEDLPF